MSRSFKKIGIIKDHNKGSKQMSKKILRSHIRTKLNNYEDQDLIIEPEKALFCSYNVCDYKWFSKDVRDKRK